MNPDNQKPLTLQVLDAIKRIINPKNLSLPGVSSEHLDRLERRSKAPSHWKARSIVEELWRSILPADYERVASAIRKKIKEIDPLAAIDDVTEQSLCDYVGKIAEGEAMRGVGADSKIGRGSSKFSEAFWNPFVGKSIAVSSVCAPMHHYDQIPHGLLIQKICRVSPHFDFLYFDSDGKPLEPENPPYDRYGAFFFLGRAGLYAGCPVLWDRSSGNTALGPMCFKQPKVDAKTKQHLKGNMVGKLDLNFHSVEYHESQGIEVLRAKDTYNHEERHRVDYALIQRVCIPTTTTPVAIVAGCTALGTLVASQQTSVDAFSLVSFLSLPLLPADNLEILFELKLP